MDRPSDRDAGAGGNAARGRGGPRACARDPGRGTRSAIRPGGDGRFCAPGRGDLAVDRPLAWKLASALGRLDYVRVRIVGEQVEPMAIGGASILSSTTRADGFVLVPANLEGYPAAATVTVWLYDL